MIAVVNFFRVEKKKAAAASEDTEDKASRWERRKKRKQYFAKLLKQQQEREEELSKRYRDRAKERREGKTELTDESELLQTSADYRAVAPDAATLESLARFSYPQQTTPPPHKKCHVCNELH